MSEGKLMLEPGTLWAKVTARTQHALQCGALLSIPTKSEFVEQNGVRFLVRILSNLVRKDEAKQKQDKATVNSGKEFNPFLPYEEDLFVTDISETHLCLLNKFNVVDYHLLIITREFEEQESLLTEADFAAMWACLAQFDGLAFYNGGKLAGASQRHKHLQIVPLPFAANERQIPIEPLLKSASFQGTKGTVGTITDFPFVNAFTRFDSNWVKSPLEAGKLTLSRYHALLHAVGLHSSDERQAGAYNLLAAREWMLIVPRSQESFDSISINSLGFAGALLVRNEQQMQILKDYGAMNVLRDVAVSNARD
jgi:sulfate adenylyltransferase (ADP) / ATP adenylyltransferase